MPLPDYAAGIIPAAAKAITPVTAIPVAFNGPGPTCPDLGPDKR